MKLEAGKKYTDRRGRVYGPLVRVDVSCGGLFGENREDYAWYGDGQRSPGRELPSDLVAEYVEPVQPEYRMLQDGETVQPDDEYCGHSEKCEKVPSSGNVFQTSLYYPHRRLVEPVKAAESWYRHRDCRLTVLRVADGRVTYFEDGIQGGSYCEKERAYILGEKITAEEAADLIRRKVEQPAPVESPDDWVTQDRVSARVGVDQENWSNWTAARWKDVGLYSIANKNAMRHGRCDFMGDTLSLRCRRKDLPPVPPKTRTVVLKEWLCWNSEYPDAIHHEWCSEDPAGDNHRYEPFDHAHATGNTRTVEIPVT